MVGESAGGGWSFNVDKKKGGRLLVLELKSSLEQLQKNVIEDFGFEETDADLELSYLPIGLINSSECPPVIIGNSRQVQKFLGFCKKHQSTQLCVSYKAKQENPNKVDIDLNKMPTDASTSEENERNPCDIGAASRCTNTKQRSEKSSPSSSISRSSNRTAGFFNDFGSSNESAGFFNDFGSSNQSKESAGFFNDFGSSNQSKESAGFFNDFGSSNQSNESSTLA
ncbi:hypothetical protein DY000_02015390 [Brassica cretica]|uniref:Uncharacterized protein n=1 Tax=Brassica cretica TaxID=69181 RepID=A0ABQ7D2Z1_BRACR|nr:hypothetical protein DY000_02015390 [Brassica cretica]